MNRFLVVYTVDLKLIPQREKAACFNVQATGYFNCSCDFIRITAQLSTFMHVDMVKTPAEG